MMNLFVTKRINETYHDESFRGIVAERFWRGEFFRLGVFLSESEVILMCDICGCTCVDMCTCECECVSLCIYG